MMNLIGGLTLVTLLTRFYNLSVPEHVCWDETHFGKMAGYYLNGTYFVDVHPPLGKMLIAITGALTGYDGRFAFANSGDDYVTDNYQARYYGMRAFSAILGSLVVPLLHCSVRQITGSQGAAILTSLLLIFDCGLLTLSQYILLDPILLFFMSGAIYFKAKNSCQIKMSLQSEKLKPENSNRKGLLLSWFRNLFLCGICLGCNIAVKWTGVFTMAFIGLWTIHDLWSLKINKVPWTSLILHLFAHAVCLVVIPCCVYILTFIVHYLVLNKSGVADGFHSSVFQSCLRGNALHNASMPLYVAYGSIITLKHHNFAESGLLHSNAELYPVEVMPFPYQQVTVYFHKDAHNFWEVLKPTDAELLHIFGESNLRNRSVPVNGNKIQFVQSGDIVRFRHVRTQCHLHSHQRRAPLTKQEQIVSCHKNSPLEAKLNELWRIELADNNFDGDDKIRCDLRTKFRLIHAGSACSLRSTFKLLPNWGLYQYEATCAGDGANSPTALWNVEQHSHRKLEHVRIPLCNMTFWERFWESHVAMLYFNYNMTEVEHEGSSRAWYWPLNFKGQAFSRLGEDDLRVYLLGNPLIFYINFWSLALMFILTVCRYLRINPKNPIISKSVIYFSKLFPNKKANSTLHPFPLHYSACELFFLAWALNYLPFLLVPRVVYFHHYYPAFLCNCCLTGCFFDMVFECTSAHLARYGNFRIADLYIRCSIYFIFAFCVISGFYLYSPLAYGVTGPFSDDEDGVMHGLKLSSSWDM